MIDLKMLIRPFYRVGAYEILFLLLFLAFFPLLELGLVGWLLFSLEFYWVMAGLAGNSLLFFFLGLFFLRAQFVRVEAAAGAGIFPDKELTRVLGTLLCFGLLIYPGLLSTGLGLVMLLPPLRYWGGGLIVRYAGLSIKEIYEYKKIYDD
ncbi:MAG: FxsA family protein [Spirochaetales bacterium]|nr:FxsA family protein [Spirochaetales bacterium]